MYASTVHDLAPAVSRVSFVGLPEPRIEPEIVFGLASAPAPGALRALGALLATDPQNPALAAGEVVTTGSLTRALPIAAGEIWTTRLKGAALDGMRVELAPG
jgi:2-keto-4-pentenoate hydratase